RQRRGGAMACQDSLDRHRSDRRNRPVRSHRTGGREDRLVPRVLRHRACGTDDAGLARTERASMPEARNGAIGARESGAARSAVTLADVAVTSQLARGSYPAVERASLTVADGEFVAIVGPTGCGKSTLLNIAAGLIAPSSGRVEIFGVPLAGLNRQA